MDLAREIKKDLEIKDTSGASGSRCNGFSVKEVGRSLGATRNEELNKNDAKVGTPGIGTYPPKSVVSLRLFLAKEKPCA